MRYAIGADAYIEEVLCFDAVIVGSGLAGLYTALNMDEKHSVCILTKESVDVSNSWLAQGGIAAAIAVDDSPVLHLEDTLTAGAGLCDREAVKVLVDEGPSDIKRLMSMNVPFDLDAEGDLKITREGGHRKNRIVHAGGDATGRETVTALSGIVWQRPNVSFMGRTFFVDIITDEDGAVSGVLVDSPDNKLRIISTRHVLICTGGIGQIYKSSTNPSIATGDGLAAAMRAGAELSNMEFIQFHPTGLYSPKEQGRAFLISEAVRGEGGLLVNREGTRFMKGTHELDELAPRDIVARAIVREMEKTGTDHVYLDVTHKPEEFLENRFPTIYHECRKRGINIARDLIPVCPVQHYLIGGIKTDLDAKTTIPGLYACGEAASTGVHGANRLASNSMLECLVFGRRAAACINQALAVKQTGITPTLPRFVDRPSGVLDLAGVNGRIQTLMNNYGGVIRTRKGLEEGLRQTSAILAQVSEIYIPCREYVETLNLAMIAKSVLSAALERRESVGAHCRED